MNRRERSIHQKIKKYSKGVFDGIKRLHHNWDHVMRVYARAEIICRTEKSSDFVALTSVLLHDIGYVHGVKYHALAGSMDCREKILPGLGLTDAEIDGICHCIEAHDPESGVLPSTIESKIVYDADLLEKSDWPGIIEGRFHRVAREFGLTPEEFSRMFIRKYKPFFYTKRAREMDNGRLELILRLFEKTTWPKIIFPGLKGGDQNRIDID